MKLTFEQLVLTNFKNHQSLNIAFGDVTTVLGSNGAGKSSIGDSITWLLYGVDALGSTLNPTPIDREVEETKVELLFNIDGQKTLLGRVLEKGKAKFYINEVPKKATPYNEFVESLFDKNLFLSLFNPTYFSSQKWQDQREQLLSYVSEPMNKEVLAVMGKQDAAALEEPLKKESLDNLEDQHRDIYKKNDKKYDRASERVLTLREQLEKQKELAANIVKEKLMEEIEQLKGERKALEDSTADAVQQHQEKTKLMSQFESMRNDIKAIQARFKQIKGEVIKENCTTCGQPLDEESVQKVKQHRADRARAEAEQGKALQEKFIALRDRLVLMPDADLSARDKLHEYDQKIFELVYKSKETDRLKELESAVTEAEQDQQSIRSERNQSLKIVDAIKEFHAKRTELMMKKMDELFTTISVRLFEDLKNGGQRVIFEIEMDGKPFGKLSTAERIRAGLELVEVLSSKSELIAPCFVDNAESILRFPKPTGQLIVARVADQELAIKAEKESVK
ncbi:hypothetical protein A374_08949 [Fictibacillus macauensis ZFHKF-1]|uniref:Nuclease SbcCD subunit C n=1 Tax=Fictibacillus macauensis ZFHKF-1 TaxID=1196324 RepID=I8J2J9_9BACL|nr:AAA family ATPase [Fictibacillus macauensis]EIT85951.1 hypothetical protein A374_08949 [Fictibacillus macauensis ZFHKF-1]